MIRFSRFGRGVLSGCRTTHVMCALASLGLAAPVAAQGFDRSRPPELPMPADLVIPAVQATQLSNGLSLRLVEMREVPLVQVTLKVRSGGRSDGDIAGLATFVANMLDEGAGGRDGLGIAAEAALLGAELSTGADWDYIYVSLNTPKRTLARSLDLLADVALRPSFKGPDVARERDLRIAQILQQRDQPNGMAALAFGAIMFPAAHPYHRPIGGDSASTVRLDSTVVRQYYQRTFRPDQAELIVTGDIALSEARRQLGERFGGWHKARTAAVRPSMPAPITVAPARSVYLVNKPKAAQSVIMIGLPGVERSNPDYAAIEVMNTILGGSFSSRLNSNLRETRGYTYGAGSGFQYRPVPGAFLARAAVRTDVTDSSLVEFFKELDAIREQPVTDAELGRARNYIVLGLPGDFETTSQMASQISELLTFGLPTTWFNGYARRVMAVTAADVQRVARKYLPAEKAAVIVVGDVATIRPGIEALNLGPISVRNLEGAAPGS